MHLSAHESCHSLVLFCILLRSCQAFKNDATELMSSHVTAPVPEVHSNVSLNRARTGGRGAGGAAHDRGDQSQVGCRELRSTKYISDGHCTSINPIKELVCAGECLPAQMLQNWIGGAYGRKFWGRRRSHQDWRCVNDKTRTQRIQLQCQDGSTRTYKITVVTSCTCKRYSRQQNESGNKFEELAISPPQLLHKHKSKSKRRLGKSRLSENWHETEP
ncbi:putative sclerostin domain-containing protein 1-like [Scophthalmus maximus]|uniref:Sclerostin domain-containing protein 1 n=1 Tax=Scophthalmus maximus TaxID=52904 RepID=A0A2U9CGF2_SCOMX|nr:sclerostin domain-containing protein 1a [Scophthalmus maximus]AWP15694.1 putative sclerostin domain-containing protein 1-like [Scophthalmus maximus]